MPRLVINPRSPSAWEIQLKPGTNLIGRGFANDFRIEDPSVSGSHCQVVINNGDVLLKDLGSTNGTYVNRAPVKEAALQAGQTIHLGSVEMEFQGDSVPDAEVSDTIILKRPSLPSADAPAPAPIRIVPTQLASAPPASGARLASHRALAAAPPPEIATEAAAEAGLPQNCKFHPKTLGRYFCSKCHQAFCELCVASRPTGGAQKKFCRHCGAECQPIHLDAAVYRPAEKGFFSRLPTAFIYPARGSGILVLVVCTVVIFGLDFISKGWLSIFAKMAFFGYLFSFMQSIIHSTAAGDEEMPGFPSFDDLFGCFLRLAGAAVLAFGPALTLFLVAFFSEESSVGSVFMIPSLVFGALYFPMALLAVAMKDTPLAANPFVVVPAIFKVPLEYLLTVIMLALIMALRGAGEPLISAVFPKGLTTHSMPKLFGYLGAWAFWNFVQVYLLAVNMRILGLLYLTKKRRLDWFDH